MRPQRTRFGTTAASYRIVDVIIPLEDAITVKAAGFPQLAMHMDGIAAACALMQVIDVLGDKGEFPLPYPFQIHQCCMRRIRRDLSQLRAAGIIEFLHKGRIALESFWCGDVFNSVVLPQPIAIAEGAQPGLRGNTCSSQNEEVLAFIKDGKTINRIEFFRVWGHPVSPWVIYLYHYCSGGDVSAELYLKDFQPGQEFISEPYTLSKEEAIHFAKQYDPQYYHVDEEAAKKGPYGRLIASGWQTAAITMKLKAATDMVKVAGGLLGMGLESVKWPRPVYPGDTLHLVLTVLEVRRSNSKPTHGIVKYRMDTYNQQDEKVMEAITAVWVPC